MINYLLSTIFILSLAIASGGILISSHLRTTYKSDFFSSLLFFEVFWFTFGFYAIWGQIIIITLIESLVETEHLVKIIHYTIFMASPFLMFAWLMFVKMIREISGRKTGVSFLAIFISIHFLFIPGTVYFLTLITNIEIITIIKSGFVFLCILHTVIGTYYLSSVKKKQSRLRFTDMKNISTGIILIMVLQNIALLIYDSNIYITMAFIILFYLFGGFLPVYFRYETDLSGLLIISGEKSPSFDLFCDKFEISKREKEVILEICSGLSNQEIADKLFISLQTVKDHTHRIYGKTTCNSRTQLINMVNENN